MRKLRFVVKLEDFEDEKLVGLYEIKELTAKEMLDFTKDFLADHDEKSPSYNEDWNYDLTVLCATKDGKKLTRKFIEDSPTRLYQALLIGVSKLNALGKEEESFLSRQS